MSKSTSLTTPRGSLAITFAETQTVKEGVSADLYTFNSDNTKDLAIVHINKGYKTPLQRILKGTKTIEGYMSGTGTLTITAQDGSQKSYTFTEGAITNPRIETEVHIGELMQWSADTDLTFYEICEPPYEDGRFENLPEKMQDQDILTKVRTYLTANARPLDIALYDFHFNKGSQEAVLKALATYQNEDGGFGEGIEPDFQMSGSSALGTTLAFQYLSKLGTIQDTELVRTGILYFIQTYDYQKNGWSIVPKEVDDYPHAPWWEYKAAMAGFGWGNPTVEILGYLLQYRAIVQDGTLLDTLTNKALQRLRELTELDKPDFHELLCCTRLYAHADYELQAQIYDKLAELIQKVVSTNSDEWNSYGATPLTFVKGPDSPFAALFDKEIIRANLDHLKRSMTDDNHWEPTWDWGDSYPEAWNKAKQAWSGKLTVDNLVTLRAFGEIEI